jgi:putative lipoic acid-binding regulatory protein
MSEETLLTFPTDFPIKIMGEKHDDFVKTIIAIVREHVSDFDAAAIELRASSGGKYISLTCIVHVTSKPQLDDIYRALTAHPMVKVAL